MPQKRKLAVENESLVGKLREQARALPCVCNGRWVEGAKEVLARNGHSSEEFIASVRRALRRGAQRGAHVALVGTGGAGKSTLIHPLCEVFSTAEKPKKDSTFPLRAILGAEILMWEDYVHEEKTVRFEELLMVLSGEEVWIANPGPGGAPGYVCTRNHCPCFYTGRGPLRCRKSGSEEENADDRMMESRFTTWRFDAAIPVAEREPNFPQCARCCAAFYAGLHEDGEEAAGAEAAAGAEEDMPAEQTEVVAEAEALAPGGGDAEGPGAAPEEETAAGGRTAV